jgi:hypothetical protein
MKKKVTPKATAGKTKSKELAIGQKSKTPLNKHQSNFNRLAKQIELLRKQLEQTKISLDKSLDFYVKHLEPAEEHNAALRTLVVKELFPYYTSKKLLTKKEKSALKEIIILSLDSISENSAKEPDNEIKAIYEAVKGVNFDAVKNSQFATMRDEMANMFEEMGLNFDFSAFHADMTEDEIMQKIVEMKATLDAKQEQMEEQEQHDEAKKKKTKKQLAQEAKEKEMEAARKKDISSLYKQLAKAFHPDLETDETLKKGKEEMMKQLTVAYDNNDLHTLLKLELEWIKKEESNLDKLSADKLVIYNEVLREQIIELHFQMEELTEHPRYEPLLRYTDTLPFRNQKELNEIKNYLYLSAQEQERILQDMKESNSLITLKHNLKLHIERKEAQMMEDFDLFDF